MSHLSKVVNFTFTYYYYYYYYLLLEIFSQQRQQRVFHRNLYDIKSLGLFSVFWPFSAMLWFGCSRLVTLFPSPPVLVPILLWRYQEHQLQLVLLSLSCSTALFLQFPSKVYVLISLFAFFQFYPVVSQNGKFHYSVDFHSCCCCCCCWLSLDLVVLQKLGGPFVSKKSKEFCVPHFLGRILGWAYTICSLLL